MEVCRLLEISKIHTTPYHPQSDGLVEWFNQTLQQMLSIFADENRSDWDNHIPFLLMAYRSSHQQTTGCIPNRLMLGREIAMPVDLVTGPTPAFECMSEYAEWLRYSMACTHAHARERTRLSVARQKKLYDITLRDRKYAVGMQVWRCYPPKANQKLGLGWTGPYIERELGGESSLRITKEGEDGEGGLWYIRTT